MLVAHVILAHKNPLQVRRLILSLTHPESLVILHIDKKIDINQFCKVLALPDVHFVKKRVSVTWGGFSQISAVVNSFKELINIAPDVQYINLLSGQDYPITPIKDFHDFLTDNPGRAYMEFLAFDHPWVIAAGERFNKYHFSDVNFLGKYRLEKLVTRILPKREFPEKFRLVGKSQWFTVDNACVKYILDFVAEKKSLYRKFKYTWGADELVFQSIIYNSPLKEKLINNNLRYIDWSENQSSPKTITVKDKEKLMESNAFFARKFDMNIDADILDFLDNKSLK
jgi:hypothetical protein